MWYVNFTNLVNSSVRTSRFILTMWYVNLLYEMVYRNLILSFILTMWYVNETIIEDVYRDLIVLY